MYWPGLETDQGKKAIKMDRNAVDVLNVRVKNTTIIIKKKREKIINII